MTCTIPKAKTLVRNTARCLLNTIVRPILRIAARYTVQPKLRQLRSMGNPAADKIANAVTDALNNSLTAAEKGWVDRIERLRSSLLASSTKIEIVDYGAGKAECSRSQKEMYQGKQTAGTVSESCSASKPRFWALVLFKLVREFKPSICVELGTCVGISAAYQAAAQQINGAGTTVTLEGAPALASLSQRNLQQLGLDNAVVVEGRFQDNLGPILSEKKPIDYAFIDGHHEEAATLSYFEQFVPYLSKQAVLVFDDIAWSDGMRHAWEKITQNERVKIALNLGAIGICVLDESMAERCNCRIWLP